MNSSTENLKINISQYVIRSFKKDDIPDIISILKGNDLYDGEDSLTDLYVLTGNKIIIAVVQITPYPSYYFLSYMSTRLEMHRKGIGSYFLKNILSGLDKPVYLYTVISEFYKKFGFEIIQHPDILPPKNEEVCKICIPEKCRTMKWSPE